MILVTLVVLAILSCAETRMDMANWMGNLPPILHETPLTSLAIPGSHDSFSYTISPDSDISPDEKRLQCVGQCLCFSVSIKKFIFKWTLTQSADVEDQLEGGLRYFDFRLAAMLGYANPYVCHGMYGTDVVNILHSIRQYLDDHQREIVLLDFQHFYNFTAEMHDHLASKIISIFGKMICPFGTSNHNLRLSNLWKRGYQVLVIYRDDIFVPDAASIFWPMDYAPTPWPNTDKPQTLIDILESNYNSPRNMDYFFITQGVLTPDLKYIFFHFYTSLERSLAPRATTALCNWVNKKQAGRNGINIVISDFANNHVFGFASSVIELNYKLADSLAAKMH